MRSPTQRSLKALRDEGYVAFVTEYWDAHAFKRKDLFGFGDILALKENEVTVVQTTSLSNISSRIKKITEHPNVAAVRKAGIRILVHGWGKKRIDGKPTWMCRLEDLS